MTAKTQEPDRLEAGDAFDLTALIPEHFARWFEFFRPGHREGIVPSRVKASSSRVFTSIFSGCATAARSSIVTRAATDGGNG